MDGMTIGELATRSGLAISAIRFYQRRGLLPPRDTGATWQRYGPDTLARLAVVELAKRAGFTLDETIELLHAADTDTSPAAAWQALAQTKIAEIDTQITNLHHMRGLLSEALACSCLTLDRATMIPAALGWAVDTATTTRTSRAGRHQAAPPHRRTHHPGV